MRFVWRLAGIHFLLLLMLYPTYSLCLIPSAFRSTGTRKPESFETKARLRWVPRRRRSSRRRNQSPAAGSPTSRPGGCDTMPSPTQRSRSSARRIPTSPTKSTSVRFFSTSTAFCTRPSTASGLPTTSRRICRAYHSPKTSRRFARPGTGWRRFTLAMRAFRHGRASLRTGTPRTPGARRR